MDNTKKAMMDLIKACVWFALCTVVIFVIFYYLPMNYYKLKPAYFSMEEVLDNKVNIKEINKVEVEKDLIKPYVYHFNIYINKQSKPYFVEATTIPYQSGKSSKYDKDFNFLLNMADKDNWSKQGAKNLQNHFDARKYSTLKNAYKNLPKWLLILIILFALSLLFYLLLILFR